MGNDDVADKATRFHLMRHAPTEWNAAGRIQGQADAPLTPAGRLWADGWGRRLAEIGLTRLLSSDTGRALATSQAIQGALGRPLTLSTDPRLREQDWGQWTGCFHRRLRKEAAEAYRRQQARGWQFRPPGGESHLEVLERALSALQDAALRHPGESILVVTHEGVIKCLLYHLAIRDGCGRPPIPPAAWHAHRLVGVGRRVRLDRVNALDLNVGRRGR
jgi:probable phosphoglycerate mutase